MPSGNVQGMAEPDKEPMITYRVETGTAASRLLRRGLHPYPLMGAAMLSTVLIVLLILLLLGAIPSWPYSRGWGYGPSGLLGIVLIVILILALTGRV